MDICEILDKYSQRKIKEIIGKLDIEKQEKIKQEILKTNFEQIIDLYKNKDKQIKKRIEVEPIDAIDKNSLTEKQKEELAQIGADVIKQNQYAVVTMAGGQGTRLGWKGPKGTYKLDIGENGKYIFEIYIDAFKKAKAKYGVEIYWYIMTSIENYNETVNFFEKHNYFGYNKNKIKFFKQNTLPIIDTEGNLIINEKYEIKKGADGNGGVFKSLKDSNIISDMKNNGIKWIYICGVDNIMVNMVDDIFLGLAINAGVQSASKSIKKAYPEEKVGIFCKKNGKPGIIEYSEMTEEMIYAKNQNGELIYNETNIISHLFNIETLEKLSNIDLEYHVALKKNSYLNENCELVIPKQPNTYKFETFIFDAFEYLDNMVILRVNREEEFAPIKNATGVDSPETAKKCYEKFFKV